MTVTAAVVGHLEWVDFAVVARVPRPGEILEARETFAAPGGGGAVAAVQLARLAGPDTLFVTAVGDDDLGHRAVEELTGTYGVPTRAAVRDGKPTRRAFTHLDDAHERTITVTGERLVPHGADDLAWALLDGAGAVYFTGGDVAALHRVREATRHLVATPRAVDALASADVEVDVLVASAGDAFERAAAEALAPRHLVLTEGAGGGTWSAREDSAAPAASTSRHWAAAKPPGPLVDAYGAGDSFAAGLTFALGGGASLQDALDLAARCGAQCVTGRGPYGSQLTLR